MSDTPRCAECDSPERTVPSATKLARLVASGQRSATEVMEEVFDRIDGLNPELNALIAVRRTEAVGDARELDARIRSGLPVGPLAGVPFTVKDVLATEGLPTTCGSRVGSGWPAEADAAVVARMKAAGAILVGKSNCSEFALSIDTHNRRYGRTRNPLGNFTAGGSSGGEAAALAAGLSAAGLGTDFGGSVRWPAQCTGVVGLRPTVGRVPGSGQLPGAGTTGPWPPNPRTLQGRLQVIGPMARTVDDVELILQVIAGPDDLDPAAVPVPVFRSAMVRMDAVECRWGTNIGDIAVTEEIVGAVTFAARTLGTRCASMTEGLPEALSHAHGLYAGLRAGEPLTEMRALVTGNEQQLTDGTRAVLAQSQPHTEQNLAELWAKRDRLRHDLLTWLRGDRLLLLPVSVVPPFPSATAMPSVCGRRLTEADIVAPCRLISLFGLPAISVPCGFTADGAPLSAQLVGPPFREDLVLAAARHLWQQGLTRVRGEL